MAQSFENNRYMSGAARLRALLQKHDETIVCPGVYDGLTARIALNQGFKCLYMTGAGTAASRLGMPDLGIVTMNDMVANASMIASLDRTTPVIADADTGYGGPLSVARTVKAYIAAGVAGLHIEDQVLAKRCGHLSGKQIVERDEYYARIKAAVMARQEARETTGGDIVLIARTDTLQKLGFDEAIERLRMCFELGADVAFLEGITAKEEARRVCEIFPDRPVLLNMVPGGVTPDMTVKEAEALGFRIIIYPILALSAVLQSVTAAYKELRDTGVVTGNPQASEAGVRQIFEVCGLKECMKFDARAGGVAYNDGV